MSIFIKICGITNLEDAKFSITDGADAIGFIQSKKSERFVSLETLNVIKDAIGIDFLTIPVFVNPSSEEVINFLSIFPNSILQFHGDEEEEFCKAFNKPYIKAINVSKQEDLINDLNKYKDSFAYLLDSGDSQNRGGTGETFDWKLIPKDLSNKIIVAGGLDSNNIEVLLSEVSPFGVDVSSGVESKIGVKDHSKIDNFIKLVKKYE
ncbi:MAG: phosphoribosylanthranilate isomerase [Gammaproteobacteria bacterium]|tara:strand:+ start:360 stop:980 length:621 start_codon:yes stop_codon:yes gene_type:complete